MDKHILEDEENRYQKACDQVYLLDNRLEELFERYRQANRQQKRTTRNSLRLQLSVVQGLRHIYYEYALAKAVIINSMRRRLFGNEAEEITYPSDEEMEEGDGV